ncbi:MAG TPA: endonuclease/exonuclease/phosphatase family protein [Candidatus Competibacteraceae bacterium]|nr:endonuclease/exonuclease/phosphatase family protein [Candidatus Competibacteraceae bacterium]
MKPGPSSLQSRKDKLLLAIGLCLIGASSAGFLARTGWLPELAAHFRVQYCLALTLLAILLRQHRFATALFAFFALVNLIITLLPLYQGSYPGNVAAAAVPQLRALTLNLHYTNQDYERVRQLINTYHPDVIVLQEITPRWLEELQRLRASYPYSLASPRSDPFGMALFSRLPWEQAEILHPGGSELPTLTAVIDADGSPFTLLGVHPLPPSSPEWARLRNQQLAEIAQFVRANPRPTLLLGDFNITPWSPYFTDLLQTAGLRDSARGYGLQPTWPSFFPLLWLPIDHCLFSAGITIADRRIGPFVGSDHYPLLVDFAVGPSAR